MTKIDEEIQAILKNTWISKESLRVKKIAEKVINGRARDMLKDIIMEMDLVPNTDIINGLTSDEIFKELKILKEQIKKMRLPAFVPTGHPDEELWKERPIEEKKQMGETYAISLNDQKALMNELKTVFKKKNLTVEPEDL